MYVIVTYRDDKKKIHKCRIEITQFDLYQVYGLASNQVRIISFAFEKE